MNRRFLIKNGRVIDPLNRIDGKLDIIVEDGHIGNIGAGLTAKGAEPIDAEGLIVAPGLIDMHAHLREPGREDEETVLTGTRAAIRGGFTTVVCMPNTEPAVDNAGTARLLKGIIRDTALANVYMTGAITKGRAGKALADMAGMKKEGIVAVSDDGSSVADKKVMLEALKAAKKLSIPVISHCEDAGMTGGGVINQGFIATKTGLRGMRREAEWRTVGRDLELAKKASARVHIAHVSCGESVDLIRKARAGGGRGITAEAAPHHFALTEDCCVTYDTNTKMNPPLRTMEDVETLKKGLDDGTIDAVATDHAPHTDAEKDVEFDFAPFGIIGLETALSIAVMELVDKKVLSWPELIRAMSSNPSRILGLNAGSLKKGAAADIVMIDPGREYVYQKEAIESKSRNSPFIGWRLKGKAITVFVGGRPVMRDEVIMP